MPRLTRTLPTIAVLALLALTPWMRWRQGIRRAEEQPLRRQIPSEAMTRASQLIDDISANRASLDRFGQDIGNPISQTGDVIALLTGDEDVERKLLTAARQQRTFQATEEAARSRSRGAAVRAAERARTSGRRAAQSYSQVVAASDDLAGLVPAATAFNTSNLRRAVAVVYAPKPVKKRSGSGTSSGGSSRWRPPRAAAGPTAAAASRR